MSADQIADYERDEPEVEGGDWEWSAEGRESLRRNLEWLYPDPAKPCICKSAYRNLGRLHGIGMGKGWVRITTEPGCYHHGTDAQRHYDECLRRFRKTGDWAEFQAPREAR